MKTLYQEDKDRKELEPDVLSCRITKSVSSTNEDRPGSRSRSPGSSACLLLQSQSPNADSGSELIRPARVEIEIGPLEV
ncbi:hypothetical protein EYF80_033666 [Liparis tanakae]|uniref:Uncharacterized protein n=1 Tax=Liparis tanakae TaxID=230148 RepID=A0A4Z2GRL4_9TELE|nr:hypothetical protein EYF80_033666 [Liparis tanakae]